jgi:hypothetical protein
MTQLHYLDFITSFEKQYPNVKWSDIQQRINEVIRKLMIAATKEPPPNGIGRTDNAGKFLSCTFSETEEREGMKTSHRDLNVLCFISSPTN